MKIYNEIIENKTKLSLIGLGYVGLPIAISFSKKIDVIGFDISKEKIKLLNDGIDPTKEVGDEEVKNSKVKFTANESELKDASFHIIAVPTPINEDYTPNLTLVTDACEIVGRNLTKDSIVVFESTVYPGVTEDICIPILERESGLKLGIDFKVGYSPERINPGDKEHRLDNIVKVVSGSDDDALNEISAIYKLVINADIYEAPSIKVAEAAKVIENAQRDINIAFMNELSKIFKILNINTKDVLEAANTKWNFLPFEPGLVGGHCIGVDPYYLTYIAQKFGYNSQIILAGRELNDGMANYIGESIYEELFKHQIDIKKSKIGLLGLTFKENCPDTRNTKVIDIVSYLENKGCEVIVHDYEANISEAKKEYNLSLHNIDEVVEIDALVVAVKHSEFYNLSVDDIRKMFKNNSKINLIFDLKGVFKEEEFDENEFSFWRL